jgi:Tfp pilus assembly protein PilF
MPSRCDMGRFRIGASGIFTAVVCCGLASGCMTARETTQVDGSFITGGSGTYGQPADSTSYRIPSLTSAISQKDGKAPKPSPRLQLAYAQLQEQRENFPEARRSYEQVLAADAKSIDAIIGLARLDQIAGRAADAENGFQKAIRLDPNSGRALDALGQFYADQKRWPEAVQTLNRAVIAKPDDPTYRFHMALAMAKSGQIEQAMPLLVETVGSAAAHYNIGLIYHERGNLQAAEDHFSTALLENPRLTQAQQWLNEIRKEQSVQQVSVSPPPPPPQVSEGHPELAARIIPGSAPDRIQPASETGGLPRWDPWRNQQ